MLGFASKALPIYLINKGDITLTRAKIVFIQNERTRDSVACSFQAKEVTKNKNGVIIVPTCQVMVFIATACANTFLGTTLAVSADLEGLPNTLVADNIAVTRYTCHISKSEKLSKRLISPMKIKLDN